MFVVVAGTRFCLCSGMTYNFDAKKLVQMRKAQFWSQEDLSAASGVSVRTIQRLEREGGGSLETWKALAAGFDVEIAALQNSHVASRYSASEKRNALIGLIFNVVGALIGNSFAWGAMASHVSEQLPALRPHPLILVIFGFGMAFFFLPSVLIWREYLR